ncbi:MAG: protein phosphatase CheZ [Gammaproteobacteria bacterium]|nr:MAG: protein phosphatase CheZ [Gammaproteobacteria bacterium]
MNSESPENAMSSEQSDEFVLRIGNLVRMLRESMKELGLDRAVEKAAELIPDARGRLSYIASMTEQAAERALNAVDRAQPLQNQLESQAKQLSEQWQNWFDKPEDMADARELVLETRSFLDDLPNVTGATSKELLEIIMAQDFQDLTGQVIKKLMELVQEVEHQLLDLIVDSVYDEKDRDEIRRRITEQAKLPSDEEEQTLLNGPQIDPEAEDVVSNQDQVDDLLDELGF